MSRPTYTLRPGDTANDARFAFRGDCRVCMDRWFVPCLINGVVYAFRCTQCERGRQIHDREAANDGKARWADGQVLRVYDPETMRMAPEHDGTPPVVSRAGRDWTPDSDTSENWR